MTVFTASFRTVAVIVALAAGSVAMPAFAAGGAAATVETPAAVAAPAADAGKRVYCVNATASGDATVTGSILNRRVCKSKAQWIAAGATFVAK